ncbi:peptidase inhibitor family I36 protein [Streptomyces sp. NPDC002851]
MNTLNAVPAPVTATTLAALAALTAAFLTPTPAAAAPPGRAGCDPGELCLWERADHKGDRTTYDLTSVDIESCHALPAGSSAQALANRTGRPVTTYQSAECAETAEFDTYPGSGTWLPRSPYRVRAFKIWER